MGASRQQLVRLIAGEANQALFAWARPDRCLYLAERAGAGQRRKSRVSGGAQLNNVFNRDAQKSLASTSQPLVLRDGLQLHHAAVGLNRVVRQHSRQLDRRRDAAIRQRRADSVPLLNNNLFSLLFQSTRMNRVPGQPLFLKDPNCGCHRSEEGPGAEPGGLGRRTARTVRDLVRLLQRLPLAASGHGEHELGTRFPIKERMSFEIRAEFFNIFNRLFRARPPFNPTAAVTRNSAGELTGGFGFVNANGNPPDGSRPRTGQLVARFQF